MANEVATKDSFTVALTDKLNEVSDALPRDLNVPRFIQNAIAVTQGNETLMNFAKKNSDGGRQILNGMMKGAYLGLDFANSESYLIPYGNKLDFMISYRGNIKLCKKYSIRKIKDIYAKLVREGDFFEEVITNGEPSINFKPKPFNDGEIQGAFAVCLFEDGGMIYDTMSVADLENTRKQSKSKNSPAWSSFKGQMYLKVVLKRLCKHIEIDFDNINQTQVFQEDMAVETNIEEQVASEISENANSEEFVVAEDVTEGGEG